jgi:colicin import membrane protein
MRAAVHERPEFLPPPEPGLVRSIGLAVLAHAVLVLALSWGLRWKNESGTPSVEAELWSAAVQQAAPRGVEVPAPPPSPPQPAPAPAVQPPPPAPREPDIALERERQRQQAQEQARKEAAERQQRAAEQKREEAARREQQQREQQQAQARKAAEERKRQDQTRVQQQQEEARLAAQREANLKRLQGLAGAAGAADATGAALQSSGPSSSYAGRIRASVRPNIAYSDNPPGNPSAEVEVRMAPDGTITSRRLVRSSGIPGWDDAVLRALDRTGTLPRDADGRVHTPITLVFRPKD